jgi:hypothetical protein
MRASTVRASALPSTGRTTRAKPQRPSFARRLGRVVWVLTLTGGALVGGILWQASARHCPAPCRMDGPPMALKQTQPPTPSKTAPPARQAR